MSSKPELRRSRRLIVYSLPVSMGWNSLQSFWCRLAISGERGERRREGEKGRRYLLLRILAY
jgi:hypothetical protein